MKSLKNLLQKRKQIREEEVGIIKAFFSVTLPGWWHTFETVWKLFSSSSWQSSVVHTSKLLTAKWINTGENLFCTFSQNRTPFYNMDNLNLQKQFVHKKQTNKRNKQTTDNCWIATRQNKPENLCFLQKNAMWMLSAKRFLLKAAGNNV